MHGDLLEQFLDDDVSEVLRRRIADDIQRALSAGAPRLIEYEFNMHDVSINLEDQTVRIDDVINREATMVCALEAFQRRLSGWNPRREST